MNANWMQWTEEISTRDAPGEDHLGVEGAAQTYQQYLVPGIITTTDHARYYGFYAWVLYRFINGSSRLLNDFKGRYYKHHEVALILACYSHHKDRQLLGGVVGSGNNSANAKRIWESSDPTSLDAKYFQNDLGGFGQYYRTAMQTMEIVAENKHPNWVYRLTPRGEALAKAYEESIKTTVYFNSLSNDGMLDYVSHRDSTEYGQYGCICNEALARGQDRELLREAFFRFDQGGTAQNAHARRRRTLGVTLDLVHGAGGNLKQEMVRPGLYLGEYSPGMNCVPSADVKPWSERWKMVEIRHMYTFGLQCLFAGFLLHLRNEMPGITFAEFMDWVVLQFPDDIANLPTADYLSSLCARVGHAQDWIKAYPQFAQACLQSSTFDEYSLFAQASKSRRDPRVLLNCGLQVLAQLFLRFLPKHESKDPIWIELAVQQRLPISDYFNNFRKHLDEPNWKVRDWLEWLYRYLILGQHEFIALEKLRYQRYDTFKFHYRDGRFYWPFASPEAYFEPIRLAALRIYMSLSILIDLGLVAEDPEHRYALTDDGQDYWQRIVNEVKYDC